MSQGLSPCIPVSRNGRAPRRFSGHHFGMVAARRMRMLTRLLSRGARKEQETVPATEESPAVAGPHVAREGASLLFVPVDGGMSFRLFSANDQRDAAAFIQDAFPGPGSKSLFFEPVEPVATVPIQPVTPKRPATVQSSVNAQKAAAPQGRTRSTEGSTPKEATSPRPGLMESIRTWPGWDTLPERINVAATLKWQQY